LSAAGKPVADDDLISFVISGLNPIYNSFVTAFSFAVKDTEMSFTDFQSEILSHEILLESQHHQALTPEPAAFALYTHKRGPPNYKPRPTANPHGFNPFNPQGFNQQRSNKPRFPPKNFMRSPHIDKLPSNLNGTLPCGTNLML
jgi:hypothetical protein